MPDIRIRIEKPREAKADNQITSTTSDASSSSVATQTLFAQQMVNTGRQIVSYVSSNIGNFSGNYIEQDKVNYMLDVLGDVSAVAMGFVVKGPVGGAIAIAGIATKKVFEWVSTAQESVIQQMGLDYLTKRSGNSTTNGSRGTEN